MLLSQGAIFNSAGYPVILAPSEGHIQHHLEHTIFDIAVLNHTLAFPRRKELARRIKTMDPETGVLVLHASGKLDNPDADIAVDSRLSPQTVLRALKRVEVMRSMRRAHSGVEGECLVIVDRDRNYIFASDAACELLGYERSQFLELRIDDVVAGSTAVTEPLFIQYVADGKQHGLITLRHRSGRLVEVKYAAEVHADGSLLARWEPLPANELSEATLQTSLGRQK